MLDHQQSNIESFPKWKCPYDTCGAENDITNPVRCWKCNKLKLTPKQRKRMLNKINKVKQKEAADLLQYKNNLSNITEDDYDEFDSSSSSTAIQSNNLEFDISKLESS